MNISLKMNKVDIINDPSNNILRCCLLCDCFYVRPLDVYWINHDTQYFLSALYIACSFYKD